MAANIGAPGRSAGRLISLALALTMAHTSSPVRVHADPDELLGVGDHPRAGVSAHLAVSGLSARFDPHGTVIEVAGAEFSARWRHLRRGASIASVPPATSVVDAPPEVRMPRGSAIEWWRERPSGLEHGIVLTERPPGDGALSLDIVLEGVVARSLSEDAIALVGPSGTLILYTHLVVRDADGVELDAALRSSATTLEIVIDDAGARYPVVVDPMYVASQDAVLTHPAARSGDAFGLSVDASSDGTRVLVGSSAWDRANQTGAGFVFVRTLSGWELEATLREESPADYDGLGLSVALSEGGATALLGQPGRDVGAATDVGRVVVFERSGATWTRSTTLDATEPGDHGFGAVVQLSAAGDVAAVFVGRPDDWSEVRIFRRDVSGWRAAETISAPGPEYGLGFGATLAMSGDGRRLLIGNGVNSPSVVFVFAWDGASWLREAQLAPTGLERDAYFGSSLALSHDGSRALVGAPRETTAAGITGTARVFLRSGSTWALEAVLVAADGEPDANFGRAVALSREGERAVIGAPGDDVAGGADRGSARVFLRTSSTWSEDALVARADPGRAYDHFAEALVIDDDGSTVVVGGDGDDIAGPSFGAVRVFTLATAAPIGAGCSDDAECLSGFCTDGVCCDVRCDGGTTRCSACVRASTGVPDGTCAPLRPEMATARVCRPALAACDPAETCSSTSTECPSNETHCATVDGGSIDGGSRVDGGVATAVRAGCGCRAGATTRDRWWLLLAGVGSLVALLRRRPADSTSR